MPGKPKNDACGKRIEHLIRSGERWGRTLGVRLCEEFGLSISSVRRRWISWETALAMESGKMQGPMKVEEFKEAFDVHAKTEGLLKQRLGELTDEEIYSDPDFRFFVSPSVPASVWRSLAEKPEYREFQFQMRRKGVRVFWCSKKCRKRMLAEVTGAMEVPR